MLVVVQIRVLDNLDEELDDTVQAVEMKTGAQIVGRIGRTLLLYRPSIRKLKAAQAAEEKAFKTQRRSSTTSPRWVSNFNLLLELTNCFWCYTSSKIFNGNICNGRTLYPTIIAWGFFGRLRPLSFAHITHTQWLEKFTDVRITVA